MPRCLEPVIEPEEVSIHSNSAANDFGGRNNFRFAMPDYMITSEW